MTLVRAPPRKLAGKNSGEYGELLAGTGDRRVKVAGRSGRRRAQCALQALRHAGQLIGAERRGGAAQRMGLMPMSA